MIILIPIEGQAHVVLPVLSHDNAQLGQIDILPLPEPHTLEPSSLIHTNCHIATLLSTLIPCEE